MEEDLLDRSIRDLEGHSFIWLLLNLGQASLSAKMILQVLFIRLCSNQILNSVTAFLTYRTERLRSGLKDPDLKWRCIPVMCMQMVAVVAPPTGGAATSTLA